jgi:hypothetical protein
MGDARSEARGDRSKVHDSIFADVVLDPPTLALIEVMRGRTDYSRPPWTFAWAKT